MLDSITKYLQAEHLQAEDIEIFLRTVEMEDWMIFYFSRLEEDEYTDVPFSKDKMMRLERSIKCAHSHHITQKDQHILMAKVHPEWLNSDMRAYGNVGNIINTDNPYVIT